MVVRNMRVVRPIHAIWARVQLQFVITGNASSALLSNGRGKGYVERPPHIFQSHSAKLQYSGGTTAIDDFPASGWDRIIFAKFDTSDSQGFGVQTLSDRLSRPMAAGTLLGIEPGLKTRASVCPTCRIEWRWEAPV